MADQRLDRDRDLRPGGVGGEQVHPALPRRTQRHQTSPVVEHDMARGRSIRGAGCPGGEPHRERTRERRCRTVEELQLSRAESPSRLQPGQLQRRDPAVPMGEPVAQRTAGG
jgi:hypothetical protein